MKAAPLGGAADPEVADREDARVRAGRGGHEERERSYSGCNVSNR
jgi:hypothetical protein